MALAKRNQHRREYEEIIKGKKTLNVRSVRFVSHGIPRSGKTTFWRRLMKLIVEIDNNKQQQSTGVADEQRPVLIELGSGMVTPGEWHVLSEGEFANKLIQMFSKLVHGKSSTTPPPDTPANASPIIDGSTGGQTPLVSAKADFRSTSPSASIPDMERSFISLFNKALESGSDWESLKCKLEDIILLSSADTGGHAEFLDMHAALINGPSFNLLFSRLTDELGEPFKVYYTDEDHTSTEEEDSDSTVEEVMFHILSSIVCFGQSHCAHETPEDSNAMNLTKALKFQQSKVMFVGTFKDQVSDEEFERKDAELQRQIEGTAFFKDVMFANHDKGQLMLKVNNESGGEAEVDENRRILKEKIEKCFPKIPIPASWFVLSLEIRNHPQPTMTLEHCEMLAKKLNIEQTELQTALWFLHHGLGVLLYYPVGELKGTVFCKIQAIYKSITDLTKKTYTARFVQHETSLSELKNFGVFSLEEIEVAPDSLIPRTLLVQLLEHLNIITSAPPALSPTGIKNLYLMPCLLRCSRQGIDVPHEENSEPLKLCFKCGFTPVGVFPAMITKLVRDSKWVILPEQESKKIFRNRVRFRVGRNIVILNSQLHYFEIVMSEKRNRGTELFQSIREVFEDTLKKVTINMNYNVLRGHEYAFWCTKCVDCDKPHLAVVKEATSPSAFLECCRDKAVTDDLNPSQKVWFSKSSKGKKLRAR